MAEENIKKQQQEKDNTAEEKENAKTDNAKETSEESAPNQEEQLNLQIAELKDQLLRKVAEFDNYRKRTSREKLEIYSDATVKCMTEFVPIIDNFERALESECQDENFKKGVEMIFSGFKAALSKLGVEEIDCEGKEFNPDLHNAVNQIESEDYGENIVCQVFQKGYKLGDKVIRHAMVCVANP